MPYRTWCYCSCMFKKSGSRIKQSEELGKNEETYGTDGGRTFRSIWKIRIRPILRKSNRIQQTGSLRISVQRCYGRSQSIQEGTVYDRWWCSSILKRQPGFLHDRSRKTRIYQFESKRWIPCRLLKGNGSRRETFRICSKRAEDDHHRLRWTKRCKTSSCRTPSFCNHRRKY